MVENIFALPGWVYSLAFLLLAISLWIYAAGHRGKRKEQLETMMPGLGFSPMDTPQADALTPDLLFHPNGFESTWDDNTNRFIKSDVRSFVPGAWTGKLGGHDVTVMDVSVVRRQTRKLDHRDSTVGLNTTAIRCDPGSASRPPDFLIDERVLFKGQVRGERSVNGDAQIGEHYFVFSDAPQGELERWITPQLRQQLEQHRLWNVAVHEGVFYLARGTTYPEKPAEMVEFLRHGGDLIAGLFASRQAS